VVETLAWPIQVGFEWQRQSTTTNWQAAAELVPAAVWWGWVHNKLHLNGVVRKMDELVLVGSNSFSRWKGIARSVLPWPWRWIQMLGAPSGPTMVARARALPCGGESSWLAARSVMVQTCNCRDMTCFFRLRKKLRPWSFTSEWLQLKSYKSS
jgi:hypothetical protein